ncbi:hypothetical protein CPB83DRAFT_852354 [Crepidotus variabilis]|uniref:Uncharacterized protein n=1 Tax=Crepidotus variabilis TaxID=179855 RepID=A0A9P6EH83_9AGAR|nr:hypothetical protein CPB83DRAFT_852354 [Crepidotus variabilis]
MDRMDSSPNINQQVVVVCSGVMYNYWQVLTIIYLPFSPMATKIQLFNNVRTTNPRVDCKLEG